MRRLMSSAIPLVVLVIGAFTESMSDLAFAADPATLPERSAILEQMVTVPFQPVSIYALEETELGTIKQYKALAVPADDNPGTSDEKNLYVGAVVPLQSKTADASLEDNRIIHYTFFLANLEGQFAATEIQKTSGKILRENSATLPTLEHDIERYEDEIASSEKESNETEKQLAGVREQASKIAEVDQIVDLKAEVAGLRAFGRKNSSEVERLQGLADDAWKASESPELMTDHEKLSTDLREVARLTAGTERANGKIRDDALATYRRKLALVKDAESADPEALAREALSLRKRRHELETKLNPVAKQTETDF